jgi:clan AA aspartic protease
VITGIVTAGREARVRFAVHGPGDTMVEVDAVVDTGFSEYLSLSRTMVDGLALPFVQTETVMLADGSLATTSVHECSVSWDGRLRPVGVHCLEGTPLAGMALLLDHLLVVEVVEGGDVTISALA